MSHTQGFHKLLLLRLGCYMKSYIFIEFFFHCVFLPFKVMQFVVLSVFYLRLFLVCRLAIRFFIPRALSIPHKPKKCNLSAKNVVEKYNKRVMIMLSGGEEMDSHACG